jgi:glycosyltransferase involved in cell wall biosynthesis
MDSSKLCIFIASHISNPKRIVYLEECLLSLVRQTIPITIYLSISFETKELRDQLEKMVESSPEIIASQKLELRIREQKTPQMRHIKLLYEEIEIHNPNCRHDWIMFCDDDDTYVPDRVYKIGSLLASSFTLKIESRQMIAGVYESTFVKDHREHRHEFWCYCVHREILGRFLMKIAAFPDVLDNKCCDVLFAEYLRRSNQNLLFTRLEEPCYNYRVDDNNDSVTGYIKTNQSHYSVRSTPPPQGDPNWPDYVLDWNDYLHENMSVFLHDVYLRTLVGCELPYILEQEFRANAPLLQYVDESHFQKIKELHERVRTVCNLIYDIPLA